MVETEGPKITVSLWVLVILALVFMVLRFICKNRYHRQRFSSDDIALILAWVLAALYVIFATIAVHYGLGKHMKDIDPPDLTLALKYVVIGDTFIILAIPISKTSFGLTLLRITTQPSHKYFIWYILISTNIVMWLCAAFNLLQCIPVSKNWDPTVKGHCWDSKVQFRYSTFAGLYSVLTDVILSTFPWLIIRNLQMNRKEKIGVVVSMSLGILAGISAAVKTNILLNATKWTDATFDMAGLLIWAIVETAITIIVSSLPYLRVLVRDMSSSYRSTGGGASKSFQLEEGGKRSRFSTWQDPNRKTHDDSSGKSILGDAEAVPEPMPGGHGAEITRVTEVLVESHEIPAKALKGV